MTLPSGAEWTSDARTVLAERSRLDPARGHDNQPPILGNFKATPRDWPELVALALPPA